MTNSMLGALVRRLRRNAILLSVLSIGPAIVGCVSAVDESTSFGFNGAAAPAGADPAASDPAAGATPGSAEEAAKDGGDPAAPSAEGAPGTPAAVAGNASDAGKAGKGGPIIASGRTTVAAYAGASVGTLSETSMPAGARPQTEEATLFTSLYAQSKAKTPVPNADKGRTRRVLLQREGPPLQADGAPALPGVKSMSSLFEIGQRASAAYDAEIVEEASAGEGSYQVASLSGLARLAPNGLMVQRPDVQTGCFEPKLVSLLHAVEARFRAKVLVTSGYRSPSHNRAVNGARRSMHMACKAADIQVPGADKFAVAAFVRSLPGRGGVGTYCHTTAVHIDIGSERDWNWACRRRFG